ncbi:hypothetical protein Taro_004792 [Colocasia esculenta]|uniref:Uncharacterized protein n=1 Tax=Colocasia esculenta TaxID=4460 RepID=A0A843TSN7_COLES|nr:hypothetical protein [Colocasia esculenta]
MPSPAPERPRLAHPSVQKIHPSQHAEEAKARPLPIAQTPACTGTPSPRPSRAQKRQRRALSPSSAPEHPSHAPPSAQKSRPSQRTEEAEVHRFPITHSPSPAPKRPRLAPLSTQKRQRHTLSPSPGCPRLCRNALASPSQRAEENVMLLLIAYDFTIFITPGWKLLDAWWNITVAALKTIELHLFI